MVSQESVHMNFFNWITTLTDAILFSGSLSPDPAVQSSQWYAWGPPNMQCRLCASCWNYWKKYGGLKTPTHLDGTARASSVSRAILPLHSGPDSETLKIKCFTKHGIYHLGIKPISCSLPPIYLKKLNQNSDLSWSSLSLLHGM